MLNVAHKQLESLMHAEKRQHRARIVPTSFARSKYKEMHRSYYEKLQKMQGACRVCCENNVQIIQINSSDSLLHFKQHFILDLQEV